MQNLQNNYSTENDSVASAQSNPAKGLDAKYFRKIKVRLGDSGKTVKALIPRQEALMTKELKGFSSDALRQNDNVLFSLEEVIQYAQFKDNMNTEYRYVVRTKNKEQVRRLHELPDNERSITVL